MLTNSNTPLVRELYAPFAKHTKEVDSARAINCKAAKRDVYKIYDWGRNYYI
jgi:site-specific DNA-adenine methylase